MALWGKKRSSGDKDSELTNSYMLIYTSSYRSFLSALQSSQYPLTGIDESLLKEVHDELFALLLLTKHQEHNIAPAISKLTSWLIASRAGVEANITSPEQRKAYLGSFDSRLNEAIKLFNDGYPIEVIPIITITSRATVDESLIKEHMPLIVSSFKKYISDLGNDLSDTQAIEEVADAISRQA